MYRTTAGVNTWRVADGLTTRAGPWLPIAVASLLATTMLAVLVRSFDAYVVLGGILLMSSGVLLVASREVATLLMVCVLYSNIPAIASKLHGVSQLVAASYLLLPLVPVVHHLVVERRRLLVGKAFGPMLLYLCALLLASLGAVDRQLAFERIQTFIVEGVVLYWLIVNAIRGVPSLRRVIAALLVTGSILGGLSLYQELTGRFDQEFGGLAQRNNEFLELEERIRLNPDDPDLQALRQTFEGGRTPRANGPIGDPNFYAQILIALVPLALFAYRRATTRAAGLWALGAGALIMAGIVVSYSRGALVALGLLLLLVTWLRWFRPMYVLVGSLCVVLLMPMVASDYLLARVGSLTTVSELDESDGAMRGRATEMLAAVQAWADYPLLGVGPGQYKAIYSVEYQQKDPRLKLRDITTRRSGHSLYLQMAAETGLLGISMFLMTVFVVMRELWSARRYWAHRAPELSDLATAFALSLVAYLATGFFLSLSYERYFWLLLALSTVALLGLRDRAATAPRAVTRPRIPARFGSFAPHRAADVEACQ